MYVDMVFRHFDDIFKQHEANEREYEPRAAPSLSKCAGLKMPSKLYRRWFGFVKMPFVKFG